jgi:hypothetical protein
MSSRIRILFGCGISGKLNDRFSPEVGLPYADAERAAAL